MHRSVKNTSLLGSVFDDPWNVTNRPSGETTERPKTSVSIETSSHSPVSRSSILLWRVTKRPSADTYGDHSPAETNSNWRFDRSYSRTFGPGWAFAKTSSK